MQELRRKVRHGDLRRLLTFTNGGEGDGWDSLRGSVIDVLDWYRAEGRWLLGKTGFVCVAERGANGGRIHVHAAIRAGYRLDYVRLIKSWSAFMTARGYLSSTGTHRWHSGDEQGRGRDGFSSSRVCAGYLAKYLTKGFDTDSRAKYEKRYRSEGCFTPEPRRIGGLCLADVPTVLADTFDGLAVECHWFESPEGDYGGWWFEVGPPTR